jgi:translocation-and-assembly-module (TAM) inner membrane subunit TamB-like protein
VGEDGKTPPRGGWKRRARIALAIFGVLLLIFHRPVLQGVVREIAGHFIAKEHLKADYQLEGNVFTSLTVRKFHAVPVGPTDVESIDVDFAHGEYSLWRLVRHGFANCFRSIDVRSARVFVNPEKTKSKVRPPGKKKDLPGVFPERLRMSDVDLVVRNRPHDFVMEHIDLDVNPSGTGELRIGKLQLPTTQAWAKLSALASYTNRTLVVRDLMLSNEERIQMLSIDASHIDEKILRASIDSEIGGGKLSASVKWVDNEPSLVHGIALHVQNVSAEAVNKYADLPKGFLAGNVERLDVDLAGSFDSPSGWLGQVTAQLSNFRAQTVAFDRCVLNAWSKDGKAGLESLDIVEGENHIQVRGSVKLPDDIKQFARMPATLQLTAPAIDLAALTKGSAKPLSGSAQINSRVDIKDGNLTANLDASATEIAFENGKIDKLSANIKATRTMAPPNVTKPWFADLRSEAVLNGSGISFRDYAIDSIEGSLSSVADLVSADRLIISRKKNELSVRGRYRLPEDLGEFPTRPEQVEIALNAPEMGDYWVSDSPGKVTGPIRVDGQIGWNQKIANGQLSIYGSNVRMRDLLFKNVSAQCSISQNVVYVNDVTASLNERDFVHGTGLVDLSAPHRYSGKLAANIADLATLEPLVLASGNENRLAGSLVIDWEGSGDIRIPQSSGQLKLVLEKGRYGDLDSVQANVEASYSPAGLDIPLIFVRNDRMYFQANAQAKGETLEISNIQLDQDKARYASGYVSIPFIWKNIGTEQTVCPPNGKVVASIQSENLNLEKLFQDLGKKPVATGLLNAKLDAKGTIADLDARLDLQIRDLKSESLPKFEPATFDLTAQVQHDQLSISGKLQQSKIQPLELTAKLPFDIPKIARARKLPDDTPVEAKLTLPRSSVNFVRQLVLDFDVLDGEVALDVDVKGTIGDPVLSGAGDVTVNLARFHNTTLPSVQNLTARLTFARNAFVLERFSGELAGGHFTMGGHVTFPKLTSAVLDLQMKGESLLVARNDNLTARADAELKVAGPFLSATVTGNMALTNSQFLKNIDLIPIGLPGRPAPQPTDRPEISFPHPPLRDWKFDVAVKTKDPFLIRGNLANGNAIADLHVGGTGLHPTLEGTVQLENVEATLPFSRLELSYGVLNFDPSDSFNPRIELHGSSVIRDYIVHVYVYGTSFAPEAIFSSEPPLPQEEIISLLATGTTREQLAGNNSVLASRASMLLVQQLYRKIFKKGQTTQSNSIFDRLDVDFGTVDPRTGQQQATARLKINDQFVVVGDVGVAGDYRGILKYLIRFR